MLYSIDLDTLRARPTDAPIPKDRAVTLPEECLETAVWANLDVLFPDEHLLLVRVQDSLLRDADILAIDPLGCVRVFELKKTPVRVTDLEAQAVSYALTMIEGPSTGWASLLAARLPRWEADVALARLGIHLKLRTKNLRKAIVEELGGNATAYSKLDRFDKAKVMIDLLSAQLGGSAPTLDGLASIITRTNLGADMAGVEDPQAAAQVILDRWSRLRPARSLETIVVGPGATALEGDDRVKVLQGRGVNYCLVDATLTAEMRDGRAFRVVLDWSGLDHGRTIQSSVRAAAARLQFAMDELGGPEEGITLRRFTLRGKHRARILAGNSLPVFQHAMLTAEEDEGGWYLRTQADSLTEGLAGTRLHRKQSLARLCADYGALGVHPFGSSGELRMPFEPSSAAFVNAYFREAARLDLTDPTAWSRAPAASSTA